MLGITDRSILKMGLSMFEKKTLEELSEAAGSSAIDPKGELLKQDDASYLFVVLQMDPEAGNEYQNLSLAGEFALTILATQYTYESDSFDENYDEDAQVKDELGGGEENFDGVYRLENDLNNGLNLAAGTEIEVDMNGYAINGTVTNRGDAKMYGGEIEVGTYGFENRGNADLENVNVKAGDAGNYAVIDRGENSTYVNVNINSAGGGFAVSNGAKVIFSGDVKASTSPNGGRYNFYVVGEGSELTITDGDFSIPAGNVKLAYIYAGPGATVYVQGGNFGTPSTRSGYKAGIMGDGTVIITGGTFGFDPSNWVAEGYQVVKNGSTWTVSPV